MYEEEELQDEFIEIKRYVAPDLVFTEEREAYGGKMEYFRLMFSFKEEVFVQEEVEEDGSKKGWSGKRHRACKRVDDQVYVMNDKHGWVIHKKASQILAEQIAEKALLS